METVWLDHKDGSGPWGLSAFEPPIFASYKMNSGKGRKEKRKEGREGKLRIEGGWREGKKGYSCGRDWVNLH